MLGVVPSVPLLLGSTDFVGVIRHAVPSRPESGSCSGRGFRAPIGPCDGFGLAAAGSWLGGVCGPPIVCTRECLGNGRAQGWVFWFRLPAYLGLPSPAARNAPAVLNPLWTTPAVTCGRRSGRLGAGLGLQRAGRQKRAGEREEIRCGSRLCFGCVSRLCLLSLGGVPLVETVHARMGSGPFLGRETGMLTEPFVPEVAEVPPETHPDAS